ncbi:metal ABC transporter permease [Mediterraneibacter sp. NSJ-55]|uniref:Metal ABC transporter permease n=1 Tax=Mediterraneibacter hominis TaxID=2763054 RepID=A0A923LFG8_9FIRM|nr:metal ABC transporter permease [Mediterraneibacter hominis]MBC5687350.1 metal ABC transporter permease [Mediterraneibacter hominis]
MFETVAQMLSYPFMVRAFLVGSLVALCSALLGVSLVLKRYSMIGDGLSHVGFGALAVATAVNAAPLSVAIPIVVLAAILLLRIRSNTRIKGDAATAMISTGALAVGVMVISMTTGMNTDVYNYMFGSILAMSAQDVKLSLILCAVVLILYVFFYQKIFAVTFDETFALATGVRANLYNTMIAVLTAVTIVLGMRMMGALLVSSLIIFPALTSMRLCKTFKSVIISAGVLSVICLVVGLILSYFCAAPAGASVVLVNLTAFLVYSVLGIARNARRG